MAQTVRYGSTGILNSQLRIPFLQNMRLRTSWTLNIRPFVRISPPHTTVVHVHSRSYAIDRLSQS